MDDRKKVLIGRHFMSDLLPYALTLDMLHEAAERVPPQEAEGGTQAVKEARGQGSGSKYVSLA